MKFAAYLAIILQVSSYKFEAAVIIAEFCSDPPTTHSASFWKMNDQFLTIDSIKWWVSNRVPQPLCPVHDLRLRPVEDVYSSKYTFENLSHSLKCEDCTKAYFLPRSYSKEKLYVLDRLDAKIFRGQKFINLDDEALPIAEHKIQKKSDYFVTSLLTQSRLGLRLVVYAGKRGGDKKTQIFVEPEIKRLAFDQKDLHPTKVFTSLEATFEDGTKYKIEKGGKK